MTKNEEVAREIVVEMTPLILMNAFGTKVEIFTKLHYTPKMKFAKPMDEPTTKAVCEELHPTVPEDAVTNIINYFVWDGEHMDEAREYVRQQFHAYAEQYAAKKEAAK
jgi:hypothetical protein